MESGLLYNWSQATKVCPKGWELPKPEDWNALADLMGGACAIGHQMKKSEYDL